VLKKVKGAPRNPAEKKAIRNKHCAVNTLSTASSSHWLKSSEVIITAFV
jgi:hypothetical protein